jgi:hypothetical protein
MNLMIGRDHVIDRAQQLQPFLMAMAVVVDRDDVAFEGVKSREQGGCAVPLGSHGPSFRNDPSSSAVPAGSGREVIGLFLTGLPPAVQKKAKSCKRP